MKNQKYLLLFILTALLICAFPLTVSANSAEPPGIIILTTNAPDDLSVTLEIPGVDGEVRVRDTSRMWENYFRIYYHSLFHENKAEMANARIRVVSGEKTFTCPLPEELHDGYGFNTLLYLDCESETLTLGEPAYRAPLLISLRLILTFIFEGAVFFLLGFRNKRSWITFALVNLITQGVLNGIIAENGLYGSVGYFVILFIAMEALIFIAEAIAFSLFVREGKWYRRLAAALLANAVSLALGIFILNYLPI